MGCLLVADLAELLQGELHWAAMPPREGETTVVTRIVRTLSELAAGDVAWCDGSLPGQELWAMSRGAQGLVCRSDRVPLWPGRFAVIVPDLDRAWQRLLGWIRLVRPPSPCRTARGVRRCETQAAAKLKVLQWCDPGTVVISPPTWNGLAGGRSTARCHRRAA